MPPIQVKHLSNDIISEKNTLLHCLKFQIMINLDTAINSGVSDAGGNSTAIFNHARVNRQPTAGICASDERKSAASSPNAFLVQRLGTVSDPGRRLSTPAHGQ